MSDRARRCAALTAAPPGARAPRRRARGGAAAGRKLRVGLARGRPAPRGVRPEAGSAASNRAAAAGHRRNGRLLATPRDELNAHGRSAPREVARCS